MTGRQETSKKYEENSSIILEHAQEYFTRYYNTLGELTSSTKFRYLKYIVDFVDYLEMEYKMNTYTIGFVKDVKPEMIKSYLTTMNESSDSIKAARLYGIKKFFNYCYENDYIDKYPFDKNKVIIPKDKKVHDIVYLTNEEIKMVLKNIEDGVGIKRETKYTPYWKIRDRTMFLMDVFFGLRVTSLIEINVDDIDFDNNIIIIREKGGTERTLGFGDDIKGDMLKWLNIRNLILEENNINNEDCFFISDRLNRISTHTFSIMLKRNTYNINKKVTPHKLRSTCATSIIEETGNIHLAAYVLGHSNLKNTMRYAKLGEKAKQQAVNTMSNVIYK